MNPIKKYSIALLILTISIFLIYHKGYNDGKNKLLHKVQKDSIKQYQNIWVTHNQAQQIYIEPSSFPYPLCKN